MRESEFESEESILDPDTTSGMDQDPRSSPRVPKTPYGGNHNKLERRRRLPHEIPNRRYAIMNFCRECHGWEPDMTGTLTEAIRNCPAPKCWLWPWRNGKVDTTVVDHG